jgi:hypothetical protein
MRDLQAVLLDAGLDLTGWTLSYANAISADGLTIIGGGDHNGQSESWIAHVGDLAAATGGGIQADAALAATPLP